MEGDPCEAIDSNRVCFIICIRLDLLRRSTFTSFQSILVSMVWLNYLTLSHVMTPSLRRIIHCCETIIIIPHRDSEMLNLKCLFNNCSNLELPRMPFLLHLRCNLMARQYQKHSSQHCRNSRQQLQGLKFPTFQHRFLHHQLT